MVLGMVGGAGFAYQVGSRDANVDIHITDVILAIEAEELAVYSCPPSSGAYNYIQFFSPIFGILKQPSVRSVKVIEPSQIMLIAVLLVTLLEPEAISKIFHPGWVPSSALRIGSNVSS